jgi:hypothetical protein
MFKEAKQSTNITGYISNKNMNGSHLGHYTFRTSVFVYRKWV